MKNSQQIKAKKRKAYSLVEMMVTLGIVGILILLLFNVILLALRSNTRIAARSFVREQIGSTLVRISREIRNSDGVNTCTGNSCEFRFTGKIIRWELCGDAEEPENICRYENDEITFQTSDTIKIRTFNFDLFPGTESNEIVIVTVLADHTNAALDVQNVLNQISTSTRNYDSY